MKTPLTFIKENFIKISLVICLSVTSCFVIPLVNAKEDNIVYASDDLQNKNAISMWLLMMLMRAGVYVDSATQEAINSLADNWDKWTSTIRGFGVLASELYSTAINNYDSSNNTVSLPSAIASQVIEWVNYFTDTFTNRNIGDTNIYSTSISLLRNVKGFSYFGTEPFNNISTKVDLYNLKYYRRNGNAYSYSLCAQGNGCSINTHGSNVYGAYNAYEKCMTFVSTAPFDITYKVVSSSSPYSDIVFDWSSPTSPSFTIAETNYYLIKAYISGTVFYDFAYSNFYYFSENTLYFWKTVLSGDTNTTVDTTFINSKDITYSSSLVNGTDIVLKDLVGSLGLDSNVGINDLVGAYDDNIVNGGDKVVSTDDIVFKDLTKDIISTDEQGSLILKSIGNLSVLIDKTYELEGTLKTPLTDDDTLPIKGNPISNISDDCFNVNTCVLKGTNYLTTMVNTVVDSNSYIKSTIGFILVMSILLALI